MSSKWYGSVQNRLEEDRQYCDEITVGTGVTEYGWSDRHPYEVIEVRDQKHVTVRALDHIHVGDGQMDNNWKLISNPDNPTRQLEKRGKYWYWTTTITAEDIAGIEEDTDALLRLGLAGYDVETIRTKGKQTKRIRAKVSFGTAQYYHDYEF